MKNFMYTRVQSDDIVLSTTIEPTNHFYASNTTCI